MKDHRLIDQRSLAFGRAIAARIAVDAGGIDHARANIARWLGTCSPRVRSTLLEWQTALDGPVAGVIELLTSEDERATRLRQSNPFAGVLPEKDRLEIIRKFYAYESGGA